MNKLSDVLTWDLQRVYWDYKWWWPSTTFAYVLSPFTEMDNIVQYSRDVPGVKAEDIKIEVTNRQLSVSAKRSPSTSYNWSDTLPKSVDTSFQGFAKLKNGVLTITFQKKPEEVNTMTIKVQEA